MRKQTHAVADLKIPTDSLRFKRLKMLFEGRCKQLKAARNDPSYCYGSAVVKYTRARVAFRRARGWVK